MSHGHLSPSRTPQILTFPEICCLLEIEPQKLVLRTSAPVYSSPLEPRILGPLILAPAEKLLDTLHCGHLSQIFVLFSNPKYFVQMTQSKLSHMAGAV